MGAIRELLYQVYRWAWWFDDDRPFDEPPGPLPTPSAYDLDPLGAHLRGGTRVRDRQTRAFGSLDGIEVVAWHELKFLERRSKGGWWSIIEMTIPPKPDLELELHVDGGQLAIRGAPIDVVDQLLDSGARTTLAPFECATLSTETQRDGRRILRLAIGRLLKAPDFIKAVDAAVRIATSIPAAFTAADAKIKPQLSGPPHREVLDDEPVRAAAEARIEQVALVRQERAELVAARTAKLIGWGLVLTTLATIAALVLL